MIFWIFAVSFSIFVPLIFAKQMIVGIETLAKWISSFLKQDFSAYVDLDSKVNDHTFMRKDGSLVTVIEYYGSNQIIF